MGTKIILLCAVPLGLAAGYGWSVITAPTAQAAAPPKAATMALPASPEERPAPLDEEWAERTGAEPHAPAVAQGGEPSVHYSGCNEVRAAGKAPLDIGQPGYRADMDGDGDGVACEPIRR